VTTSPRAKEKVAAVNEAVRAMIEQVEAVAQASGAPQQGGIAVYGPVERCVVPDGCGTEGSTALLQLKVWRSRLSTWGFVLEAKVDEVFEPVVAGWMTRGVRVRRGFGQLAVNLENLRAAAPAYPGRGYLLAGFANAPVAKALTYVLTGPADGVTGLPTGFTPDPEKYPAVDAVFRGFKTALGTRRVRVAGLADVYADAASDTGDELGIRHVAYNPPLGGRAYAVVTNFTVEGVTHGDVPNAGTDDHYFLGRACYAAGQPHTPVYKEWFLCARGAGPGFGPAACVTANGGVGVPDPDPDITGTSWDDCPPIASEPAAYDLPDDAGTTPDDTSAEQGEDSAGLVSQAQSPPEDPGDVPPPT
jgi:hypothetical protein